MNKTISTTSHSSPSKIHHKYQQYLNLFKTSVQKFEVDILQLTKQIQQDQQQQLLSHTTLSKSEAKPNNFLAKKKNFNLTET